MLIRCPVCPSACTEVLMNYKVSARKESDSEIGALATYQCLSGHIFFVRVADLSSAKLFMEKLYGQPAEPH